MLRNRSKKSSSPTTARNSRQRPGPEEDHLGADRIGVARRTGQSPAGNAQVLGHDLLEAIEQRAVLVEKGLERELAQGDGIARFVRVVQRLVVAVPVEDGKADLARLVDPGPAPATAEDPVQEVRADHRPFRQAAQVGVVVDGDGDAGGLGHAGLEVLAAEERQIGRQLVGPVRKEQTGRGDADRADVAHSSALFLQQVLKSRQKGLDKTLEFVFILVTGKNLTIDLVIRVGEQTHFHAHSGTDVNPNE